MGQFLGFVQLESSIDVAALAKDSSVPKNADALPTYRVYGPAGLMQNGTGTAGFKDSGTITGATNAGPVVVTSAAHGLTTGTRVTVTGVLGNTAANGTWVVTRIDADTFSLDGSTGNGAYTSGGAWNVTGLYTATVVAGAADGYSAGVTYTVFVSAVVSSAAWGDLFTFTVA